jgi:hypothetical protein
VAVVRTCKPENANEKGNLHHNCDGVSIVVSLTASKWIPWSDVFNDDPHVIDNSQERVALRVLRQCACWEMRQVLQQLVFVVEPRLAVISVAVLEGDKRPSIRVNCVYKPILEVVVVTVQQRAAKPFRLVVVVRCLGLFRLPWESYWSDDASILVIGIRNQMIVVGIIPEKVVNNSRQVEIIIEEIIEWVHGKGLVVFVCGVWMGRCIARRFGFEWYSEWSECGERPPLVFRFETGYSTADVRENSSFVETRFSRQWGSSATIPSAATASFFPFFLFGVAVSAIHAFQAVVDETIVILRVSGLQFNARIQDRTLELCSEPAGGECTFDRSMRDSLSLGIDLITTSKIAGEGNEENQDYHSCSDGRAFLCHFLPLLGCIHCGFFPSVTLLCDCDDSDGVGGGGMRMDCAQGAIRGECVE